MEQKRNGRTIVLVILAFGVVFTAALIATTRSIGFDAKNFDPPDVALPAGK